MIERVYYRVKLDANTFIYTPYLSNIPTSITDIPTNVTYDTTDGITLKTEETWTYDNNESSSVTAEREIPLKAGDGVTMDVSEDGKYVVIKVDPKRETYIGTSVPTDDYPDLFVNTADDLLSYKAPDGSWKPIAGGGSGGGLVDDVRVNGQSIVENKVANIVVDTELNEQSLNPIANSLFATRLTALGTTLSGHINNKTNPHNVTAAQLGLGNVDTELAAVEGDISAHKKDTDNPHNVTATQIGLGNVDNTSDADKPVSSKQAVAINAVENQIILHKDNKSNPHAVTAAQVGLGNVNNTSDANKPVSTAQQAALDKKIDKAGGTFSGNVAIQGNLTVSGTTTTESEQQLAVKENVIVTNADKANLQTLLSGLAINKNSTATYGIMYDPADDTVKFGEGTLDANRKFVFKAGEGHPLAIRVDSSQFTDAVLVKWNATTKAFEPAGGSWQNLLDKIEITDIDLTLGDETVLYDTTNGIQLSATGKITRKDGTSEQPQVDLDIPIVPGKGIIIDKVADKEQVEAKVDTSVVALKSDLTPYAKTVDVVAKSQVGAASGVASLGADGKVPAAQLPGSGGSIDADTLNGLLSAGDGISIGKTTAGDKVEVKIDKSNDFLLTPLGKVMGVGSATRYLGFTLTPDPKIKELTPVGVSNYTFEVGAPGNRSIICKDNLRTIFGKQSLAGFGNIDLYQHNICYTSTDPDKIVKIRFIVISSKNLIVDSLTDLKTLLGNTFTYPVNGANSTNNQSIYEITETGYKSGTSDYVLYNTVTAYPAGTWTDTVTTI